MSQRVLYEGMVSDEVRRYRAEPPLPFFDESGNAQSPLAWWKSNEQLYPSLSKYARQVLAIPATSAPSERVFSVAGQIVTKKRALVWLKGAWNAVDEFITKKRKRS